MARPGGARVRAIAAALFAVLFLVAAGCAGDDAEPQTTKAAPVLEQLRVIFPEGFTVRDMADRVKAVRGIAIEKRGVTPRLTRNGFLAAVAQARPPKPFIPDWKHSMEGFLFPAVYDFTQETTAKELVSDQLTAFRKRFATVNLKYARSKNLTPYDVLIIASMVEKEAAVAKERPLIAAVIYNRLRARLPLGIDATLRYGLDIPPTESITKAALRSNNPYNTRKLPGLPPTPIANPGLASLRAAAHPAGVDYLYFVRIPGTRRHFFTADENLFLRRVCEYGYGCD
jgi:uncharacterized YceG family protein